MMVDGDGFDVDAATHIGRSRKENQDRYMRADEWLGRERRDLYDHYGRLYIVADGVGGSAGGAEASQLAVEQVMRHFYAGDAAPMAPDQRLRLAIERASAEIHARASDRLNNMASTIVAGLIHQGKLTVANVGDSPAFLFRRGERPRQLTVDHSVTDSSGETSLTQAMGDAYVKSAISSVPFAPDDTVVLCSDGLSSLVDPVEIQRVVSRLNAAQATQSLIRLANSRGGYDNITVLVVRNGVRRRRAPWPWRTIGAALGALFSIAAIVALLALAPAWLNDMLSFPTPLPQTPQPGPATAPVQPVGAATAIGTPVPLVVAIAATSTPGATHPTAGVPPVASVIATSTLVPTVPTATRRPTPRPPTRTPRPIGATKTITTPLSPSAAPVEPTATSGPVLPNDLVGIPRENAIRELQELGVPRNHILVNGQCRDDVPEEDRPKFDRTPEGAILSMDPRGNTPIDPETVIVHLAVRAPNAQCAPPTTPASAPAL